ncbi:MAG TPA: universal stress protein [Bryobacteraceae bacterium]|nr:universal stress protein [Bryobacteraceae bacterium]HPQ14501.1 universal stress protein [Bryobacteraceae bacterium]HPU73570.1 universal stress protein [Bryobacteraceae bacterium]
MLAKNSEFTRGTDAAAGVGHAGGANGKRSLNQILLPVDFTERSLTAARRAADLARRFEAEVLLVHVGAPARPGSDSPLTPEEGKIERAVSEVLETVPFRRYSLRGDPAQRILDHARRENIRLIVMPTRGRKRFLGLLHDSLTARIIQDAPCPVWTWVGDAAGPLDIQRVLCALALGPSSGRVLRWAARLAERFEASLSIVHCDSGFGAAPGIWHYEELHAARRTWARQDIASLQSAVGTRADVWLEAGPPEQAIAAVARGLGADLVVIGKGHARWRPAKLCFRAYDIVCEAPCPVAVC